MQPKCNLCGATTLWTALWHAAPLRPMSTQSCSSGKAARPMNAHQTGKHSLLASCKKCSQRFAYLTGDNLSLQAAFQSMQDSNSSQSQLHNGMPLFNKLQASLPNVQILLGRGVLVQGARHCPRRTACPGHAGYALPQKRCSSPLCSHASAHALPMLWSYWAGSFWWNCTIACRARHTAALSTHAI